MNVDLGKLRVTLYPELVAMAVKGRPRGGGRDLGVPAACHDLLCVYLVAKRLDANRGRSGLVEAGELEAILMALIGCKPRHARDRVRAGDGLFWNLPARAGRRAGLRAHTRVVEDMRPDYPASRPCEVQASLLSACAAAARPASALKALMVAMLAARNGTRAPVSVRALAEAVGHCERSVWRWLGAVEGLVVTNNFEPLTEFERYGDAVAHVEALDPDPRVEVQRWGSGWLVCRQMANSYELPQAAWIGWRNRSRALKELYARPEPVRPPQERTLLYEDRVGARFWKIACQDGA